MSFVGNAPVCPICDRSFPEGSLFCPYDSSPLRMEPKTLDEDPLLGTAIDGKFTIRQRLGAGGMGVVYAAVQHSLDRIVALKVLAPRLNPDRKADQRFRVEARAASLLRSPHAVKVHDFGVTDQGLLYLAMELIEGESLRTRLRNGPLPLREAITIAAEIAEALGEAHSLDPQIIHRDIKPDNVMIRTTHDGVPFAIVLDFGLALFTDDPRLTGSHAIVGTVAYMAPERLLEGAEIGEHVDVYALGVTLFEMLTGETPFTSPHQLTLMQKHLHAPPPTLREMLPGAPQELEELLLETLAKKAADRPSASDIRARLLLILDSMPRTSPTAPASPLKGISRKGADKGLTSDPTRRQPRAGVLPTRAAWPLVLVGTMVLAAVAGGWLLYGRGPEMRPARSIPVFVPAPQAAGAGPGSERPPNPPQPLQRGSPSFRATPPGRASAAAESVAPRKSRKAEPGPITGALPPEAVDAKVTGASTPDPNAGGGDVAGFDQAILNELKEEGHPK